MRCGYTGEGQRGLGRERVLSCTEGGFTLLQIVKTLRSVCLHRAVPKDVRGGEPQECPLISTAPFPASREGPVACCQVVLLCSAFSFSVLIMASEIFRSLCLFGVFCTGV